MEKDLYFQSFNDTAKGFNPSEDGTIDRTVGCALYAEDGITNLMALVKQGSSNKLARMTPTGVVDLTGDVKITMTIIKYNGATYATYEINDVLFKYNDWIQIPIIEHEEHNELRLAGSAVLVDVYGDLVKMNTGVNIFMNH